MVCITHSLTVPFPVGNNLSNNQRSLYGNVALETLGKPSQRLYFNSLPPIINNILKKLKTLYKVLMPSIKPPI